MLTHAMNGKCSVNDVANWMCAGPARVYGMKNKGSLIEGYDGDLTLVDLENRRTITDADTWTKVGWTPYDGMELTGGQCTPSLMEILSTSARLVAPSGAHLLPSQEVLVEF